MKKRVLSLLMTAVLVLTLLPMAAFALDEEPTGGTAAIQLGTGGISSPTKTTNDSGAYYTPNSYIYFGQNNGTTPIKWRVLDANKNNNGEDSGMFLLSEYLLAESVVFEASRLDDDHDGQINPNDWQNSDAQVWCKDFAGENGSAVTDAFSEDERTAIQSITKKDNKADPYNYSWTESKLDKDKVFFLSAEELADYVGNYNQAPGLMAYLKDSQNAGWWWLRSPVEYYDNIVGYVVNDGMVNGCTVDDGFAARPALNLNLSSVLFTSAADNSGHNASFTAPADYSGDEWKMTLEDGNSFASGAAKTSGTADLEKGYAAETLTFSHAALNSFSGAGYTNVTAALTDSDGNLLYYGSVNDSKSATSSSVTIPAGLAKGTYTLSLYGEDWNSANETDYATGTPITQTITVTLPSYTYDIGNGSVVIENGTNDNTLKVTQGANTVDNIPVAQTITLTGGSAASPSANTVAVNTDRAVKLTLDDLHIGVSFGYVVPLALNGSADVTLTLVGANNLYSESADAPCVALPEGAKLTVNGSGSGSTLTVTATQNVGIGGSGIGGCGSLTVNGGAITVSATGGAGIGGGNAYEFYQVGGNGGVVTVNGGTLAVSSDMVGIGGGIGGHDAGGSGGTVIVNGGTLTVSATNGVGIGGGTSMVTGGAGGTVIVTGGTLSVSGAVAIGGGIGDGSGADGAAATVTFKPSAGGLRYKSANTDFSTDMTGAATVVHPSTYGYAAADKFLRVEAFTTASTSGGGSSGGSTSTTTTTTTNPDGSTTTKVVNKTTGAVTETTKNPDGSKTVVTSTTQKQSDGSTVKSEITVNTDKTGKTTGTAAKVTSDSTGGKVTVPAAVIETLAKSDGGTLNIETPQASIVLDHAALEALVSKGGKTPALVITPVPFSDLPKVAQDQLEEATTFSFDVNGGGLDFGAGTVTVSLNYTRKAANTIVSVLYVDDQGAMTRMPNVGFAGGKVTYKTNHFSLYAIVEEPMPFTDVAAGAYYADAVAWATTSGVTGGTSTAAFSPFASCTRAQTVTFLWRAMGSPEPVKTVNPFTDVSADAYYYKAVLWAVEQGITGGKTADTFAPNAPCTRAQTVAFLWRAAGKPVVNYAMNFADVPADAYYTEAVRWAVSEGIASGTGTTAFSPENPCTRAQIVTFLYRHIG
jgi:hypothetical protein